VATWLVTGANKGIGLELVRQTHARGEDVVAACRASSPELDAVGCRAVEGIDVSRDDVGSTLDRALEPGETIDVLVCNAGTAHWESLETLDFGAAREQFEVNTLGPLRVVTSLLPRLGAGSKVALVSSKAGSIGDRPSGGNYGYRMSKAALNMAGANLAHESRAARDPRRRSPSRLRPHGVDPRRGQHRPARVRGGPDPADRRARRRRERPLHPCGRERDSLVRNPVGPLDGAGHGS
jgi:NAD(P)-dependent dehydrogenase (short-subunit alcohol dehydrogenase family)